MGVTLRELTIGDDPTSWSAAGFAVSDGEVVVGGVRLLLAGTGAGRGLRDWALDLTGEPTPPAAIDGLPTRAPYSPAPAPGPAHPNGVLTIDHLVVLSPDLQRTAGELARHGLEARRRRDTGTPQRPQQQVFYWLGEVILELVGPRHPRGDGPARFFGLAFAVSDIDATASHLAGQTGRIKEAVQPGRRITTLRTEPLGISVPIAFISPHPRQPAPSDGDAEAPGGAAQ